jgi:hypothetical protein
MPISSLDFLSLHLVVLPPYALLVLSFFLITFFRRLVLMPSRLVTSVSHIQVFEAAQSLSLVAPLCAVTLLTASCIRGFEGVFFLSHLLLEGSRFKLITTALLTTLTLPLFFHGGDFKSTSFLVGESIVALCWLAWSVSCVFLLANIITYIFFLEVLGVLLTVSLLYHYMAFNPRPTPGKGLNLRLSHQFKFIYSLLFFVWSSAVAMLLMFWVSSLSGLFGVSLEAPVLSLTFSLQAGFLSLSVAGLTLGSGLSLFFVAVMLKAAILPFQGWLITFYKSLSPTALYFYLLTYYVYFILVVYHLLFVLLSPMGHAWALALMLLLPANLVIGLLTLGEATRLKNLLAVSSAINLFILLALANTGA